MRRLLRDVFDAAIARVDARHAVLQERIRLRRCARDPVLVIAFGKAARPMAEAVAHLLPDAPLRGLVVPPSPDTAPLPPFEVIAGGHPLPTAGSLRAARRALDLAASITPGERLLFLVSGGGSAMLEAPADDAVTLTELRTFYQALLGCGADIGAINTVRGWCSTIKGGRLARAGRAARSQLTLAISDVPAGSGALASNPTGADATTLADCFAVLDRHRLWPVVPAPLRARMQRGDLPPGLAPDDELHQRSETVELLNDRTLGSAALAALRERGLRAEFVPEADDLPCAQAADLLLARLARLRAAHPGERVAVVAVGELLVQLPSSPGAGGRNQQFALTCAERIADRAITVLSCGSDGIDGNSPAAGAVVDGTTAARARARGLDIGSHLARCDAFPLLDALGDTVLTGPTQTNVRDLRLLAHDA